MRKRYFANILLGVLLSAISITQAAAQVALLDFNPYTQDFNTLSNGNIEAYFTNNLTVPGVYLQTQLDGYGSYPAIGSAIPYYANDGAQSSQAGFYSFGSAGATDRALGGLATTVVANGQPLVGNGYIALRFLNKTGRIIQHLDVSYVMEQWYNSGKLDKAQMLFDYQLPVGAFSGKLHEGTWTNVADLNGDAPSTSMLVGSKIGNAPANRRLLTTTIQNLNLGTDKEVVLRWRYALNKDTNAHGLGIDDVSIAPQAGNLSSETFSAASGTTTTTQAGTSSVFYYAGNGNIENLKTWATKPDNTSPKSFTSDNQVFHITTNGAVVMKTNFISGKNTRLVVGDGNPNTATRLDLSPSTNPALTIDVASNGYLQIDNSPGNLPVLGRLAKGSTVHYNTTRSDILINAGNFSNLRIDGASVKTLAGNVTISGTLSLTSNSILQLNSYDVTIMKGGTVTTDGATSYIRTNAGGGLRQTVSNTNVAVLYPVGNSKYTPAWLSQTTAGVEDVFGVIVGDSIFRKYETPRTFDRNRYDSKALGREKKGLGTPVIGATTSVAHTWYVSEAELGGSNMTMTLQSQLPTTIDPSQVMLNHYHFDYWDVDTRQKGNATVVDAGNRIYKYTRTGVSDFSPFAVGSETPLPVELTAFTAKPMNSTVVCNWTTASELNNAHFVVERSLDGQQFQALGTVKGAGTSGAPLSYSWTDTQPASATAYYRLRQVDLDGTATNSPVVAVKGTALPVTLTAAPNPSTGHLTLTFCTVEASTLQGTVTNIVGAEVLRFTQAVSAGLQTLPLDLSAQPAGVYLVRILTPQGPQMLRVIKQ